MKAVNNGTRRERLASLDDGSKLDQSCLLNPARGR